jgi:Spy/CpxP family protein refolding chaperone
MAASQRPSRQQTNMTKHILIALAAVAGSLTLQPLARADATNAPATPATGDRASALRERMQETARELNLTPEQTAKLQTIVRERMEKMRALRQDTSLSSEERREKFQAGREELFAEVKKVLTPEQFEKWKAKQGLQTGGGMRPMARIQEAIQDLNLTDDQMQQLTPLYTEQIEKLRDLYQDPSLSMAQKVEKLKAIRQEVAPKLKKVFTADQYSKWEKSANQFMDELQQRFQGAKQN